MKGKEIVYFILMVAVIGLGVFGISRVKSWYDGSQQNEQRGRTMEATSGIIEDGTKADAERGERDTGLQQAREDFQRQYQEDKRNDKDTSVHSSGIVPQRVRDNFRARRLARERLGCAGEQCLEGSEEDTSSER